MKTPFLTKAPSRLAILLSPLAILLTIIYPSTAAETVPVPLEQAALAGNWKNVISVAGDVEKDDAPYTARLIKGHACLALNRGNESAAIFFTRITPENLASYREWTISLVGANPQSALAHYFNGDALARQQQWEDSLKEFDAAVQIDSKLALAYNARGVVHAVRKEIRLAKLDFQKAAETSNGRLADAYCNAGYLFIQQKDAPKGAKEAFDDALAVDKSFALAAHGRGCIALVTGDAKQAEADIVLADAVGKGLYPVLCENEIRYAAHIYGKPVGDLVAELSKPGMTLTPNLAAIAQNLDQYSKQPQWLQHSVGPWFGANQAVAALASNPGIINQLTPSQRVAAQNVAQNIMTTNDPADPASFANQVGRNATSAQYALSTASTISGMTKFGTPSAVFSGVTGLGGIAAAGIGQANSYNQPMNFAAAQQVSNLLKSNIPPGFSNTPVAPVNPFTNSAANVPPGPAYPQAGAVALVPLEGKWPFAAIYCLGYGIVD